jgi:tRNA C32,U32 (ribose-2'-O)-methylase TrmJ
MMDALDAVKAGADLLAVMVAVAAAIGSYFVTRSQVAQHAKRIDQISQRQDMSDEKHAEFRENVAAGFVRHDYLDKIETKLSERIRDLESTVRSTSSETLALLRTISRDVGPRRD